MVPWLGPAIMTAILHVVYPDRSGVLNNTLKEGMARLGIWPPDLPEDSLAAQYEAVNPIVLDLAKTLGIDVWTLDYLWWYVAFGKPSAIAVQPGVRRRKEHPLLPRRTSPSQSSRCPRPSWPGRHLHFPAA